MSPSFLTAMLSSDGERMDPNVDLIAGGREQTYELTVGGSQSGVGHEVEQTHRNRRQTAHITRCGKRRSLPPHRVESRETGVLDQSHQWTLTRS
jgi:hypothetical protein